MLVLRPGTAERWLRDYRQYAQEIIGGKRGSTHKNMVGTPEDLCAAVSDLRRGRKVAKKD
jgi:hypothetical protein